MTGRLQGKAAFVTGGGAGIGRAIALAMVNEGAIVAVADIDRGAAERCAAEAENCTGGGAAIAFECDISHRSAVAEAVSSFVSTTGRLDVLVNNAVMFHYALFWSTCQKMSSDACSMSASLARCGRCKPPRRTSLPRAVVR